MGKIMTTDKKYIRNIKCKTLFLPYLNNKTTSYVTKLHYADIYISKMVAEVTFAGMHVPCWGT
jgi:hypothetical protein